MRIKRIHLVRLRSDIPDDIVLPLPSYINGGIYILQVETDEGLVGLGEPSPYGAPPEKMAAAMASPLMRSLLGKDPLAADALPPQPSFCGGYGMSADQALMAGCSQAIWDLRGKIHGKPLHRLLVPDAPRIEKGRFRLSDRPGLGIALDEAFVRQFLADRVSQEGV